jgi:putative protease
MKRRRVELLAPGGDLDAIRAAVAAGADAIYCGLDKLNARHRATNITLADLGGVLALAHRHGCRVFLTLNVMMVESDIPVLIGILNRVVNTTLDGVIVQDLGLLHLLSQRFPGLEVHASTQLTTHNQGQLGFLSALGASRVNLSRELSIDEIGLLSHAAREAGLATEVFVHGSYCLSFSGICYMSSVRGGNSGNRGRCSQPCRDRYATTPRGCDYPLNLKDNRAYLDLKRLADAGVDAMKIEGRMKPFHYVHVVTSTYSRRLRSLDRDDRSDDESRELCKVFNRGFSNAYLAGDIGPRMFSDHPRNRAAATLERGGDRGEAYDAIAAVKAAVGERIEGVRVAQTPLTVRVSGEAGALLDVSVRAPDTSFVVSSESPLAVRRRDSTVPPLDAEWFHERLRAINDTEYRIERLDLTGLAPGLFVAQKELTAIRNSILGTLNGSAPADPVAAPVFSARRREGSPSLSVRVATTRDLHLCKETCAEIHFQLPNAMARALPRLVALFADNPRLTPWFPSVLIGDDYAAAAAFLHRVRPRRLVTNNTGVAHEAWSARIPWIAGPYLNIANSLSLVSLRRLGCHGAFVSSELGAHQIRRICPPEGFELHYSIYHPILLLTSRQCLFFQVTGCEKPRMDGECVADCERSARITDLKGASLFINKARGDYCSIYHRANFLNTAVVTDIPDLFSGFSIDLRDVETETETALDKTGLVQLFVDHLRGGADGGRELERSISPTTSARYRKGI